MDEQEVLLNLDPNIFKCCYCGEYVYRDRNDKIYTKWGNRVSLGACFRCEWTDDMCFKALVRIGVTLNELASTYPKIKQIQYNYFNKKFIYIR